MHVYQDVNMHVCHLTSQLVYKFSVFQIRDGSWVKTPMATATWPDTDVAVYVNPEDLKVGLLGVIDG